MKTKSNNVNVTVSYTIFQMEKNQTNKQTNKQKHYRVVMGTLCISTKGNDMFFFL